jgi:CHAT domain-containing protein/Tfp pilus assembly protein PilF
LAILLLAGICLCARHGRAAEATPELEIATEQAEALAAEGRYADAIPHAERALKLGRQAFGPKDLKTIGLISELGRLYELQGRYKDAEPLYKRALALANIALGSKDRAVANGFANLANLYRLQGRYKEAEPLFKRALQTGIKALGADHLDIAWIANNAALLYLALGRYDVAEKLYLRSMAIIAKRRGEEHLEVATAMNNAANFYYRLGRYRKAERLHRRALVIRETGLGPEHPAVATSLGNLGGVYRAQGRYEESERLYGRALEINERRLGPSHPKIAAGLNSIAALYDDQARYDEAEPLLERAIAIHEAALGRDHVGTASLLNNLATIYYRQARYDESEPLQMRALAINRKALGPDNLTTTINLHNTGELNRAQDKLAEAEQLHLQALKIREQALGSDHPDIAYSHLKAAGVYRDKGDHAKGIEHIRRSTAVHRGRAAQTDGQRTGRSLDEQARARPIFLTHLDLLNHRLEELTAADQEGSAELVQSLLAEAFEVAQLARASSTSQTVARMAARFATGSDALAQSVRARQDAVQRLNEFDSQLLAALGRPPQDRDSALEERLRTDALVIRRALERMDAELAARFPDYAELVSLRPMNMAKLQGLLADDEAVLIYLVDDGATYIWVGRRDRAGLFSTDIGREELDDEIAELRANLDPTGVESLDDIFPYDITAAHYLYKQLIAPAAPLLEGASHVMTVPDGALQSLPFGLLISDFRMEASKLGAVGTGSAQEIHDFHAYRDMPWLTKKYALTVLPSIGTLNALRGVARASQATQPFLAFADPLLEGAPGGARGIVGPGILQRIAEIDVDVIRQMARLPDTAREVRALADTLSAGAGSIFLAEAATETTVRSMNLTSYRILAFATHGLMAGEFGHLNEPALVLTPPEKPSDTDDGLLTASEIAGLNLDAEWVLLSACNTAAADGSPGAEGLSGLAKAFFYAGSRALLVSNWSVVSEAATRLTTTMLATIAEAPGMGRAEALRRAMLAVMADAEKPHYGHPMFWAPFVVVGEGGAAGVERR